MSEFEIKTEPFDLETEQIVLGSVFQDNKLVEDIIDIVKREDFYTKEHKDIFTAISYLHHNNEMIDYTNVISRLEYKKSEVKIDYILGLSDSIPSTANFAFYVDKLVDTSRKRDMHSIGKYLVTKDISGVSSKNLVKMMEETIEGVNLVSNIEITETKDYAGEWLKEFDKPLTNRRMRFGMVGLDDIVSIETTGMTAIAGTTGSGKSALALFIAKNLCLQGKAGLFITLEMSKKQVVNRLVANMAKIPHSKIKNKEELNKHERKELEEALKTIGNFQLTVHDRGSMTIEHLFNLSKKLKKLNKLDFVIVDYLQLLDSGKQADGNEAVRIGYISRKLKMLAQDLYVPVFALSQLNRTANERVKNKQIKPELHHLKSSSSIEQDANHVIMLHNVSESDTYTAEDMKRSLINIYIRKNREGETGKVYTHFYGDYLEFEEVKWNDDEKKFIPVNQRELGAEITDEDLPF